MPDEGKTDAGRPGSFLSSLGKVSRGEASREEKPAASRPAPQPAPQAPPSPSQLQILKTQIVEELARRQAEKKEDGKTPELEKKILEIQEKISAITSELKRGEEEQRKAAAETGGLLKSVKESGADNERRISGLVEKLEGRLAALGDASARHEAEIKRLSGELAGLPAELTERVGGRTSGFEALWGELRAAVTRQEEETARLRKELAALSLKAGDNAGIVEVALAARARKLRSDLEARLDGAFRKSI
ncbi:MAG: hypothetical protein A2X28_08720 [Elusimicrobia bacterium GWA2_56_46]|nr:MAG: hypothetical protein A2X28_08720 [Elusimicrobia bacterium GWA2_56_46]OGR55217.1 MAG: hypothetical protein A2X39_01625 [Elusimicrobia bacterium GWC2_56_31]HBW23708.1 hypothetical protein [Elusimicrobiota bacterium]